MQVKLDGTCKGYKMMEQEIGSVFTLSIVFVCKLYYVERIRNERGKCSIVTVVCIHNMSRSFTDAHLLYWYVC